MERKRELRSSVQPNAQRNAMLCYAIVATRNVKGDVKYQVASQKQASKEEGKESIGNEVQLNGGCGNSTTANHQTSPNKPGRSLTLGEFSKMVRGPCLESGPLALSESDREVGT
ncbi:hypothetical protein FVEG_14679 [Fusarium verticillioides 7600]|uniref:Uncharacterized protein n=1 Tax=Gibberella moniliformis (strain M3125 / FGSC 7600) TaxID=334819 RepID=W7LD19_GIBM7|nr:hypothetical protein FVEG_14679 [Fusarium verticillioides 7600]EWG36481.1 hypothetical protein FVEG_14679 [Fusarium verticillioides 7600]